MAAIEADGLTKHYGETRAVEDLSLTVREGEVFGFLGPNGAGKTTTIRTLLGFLAPTAGSATVLGRDVTDEEELIEAKRRLGYLPSDPGFHEGVTGRRLLRYHASLKGDERSADLLERFDAPVGRVIGEYSRGNRQKLAIVLAFMHDPDLAMAHLLSIPYLLACGGIGLLLSVLTDDSDIAKRGSLGAIFGLFLLDTVSESADVGWLGAVSPTRYYDPTAILVSSEYDLAGAAALLVGTAVLVAVSAWWFRRKDIE